MAIEDEIINISDIDIGTEILKSDKLLIETSNGTKMIAFKDFVVGPDNISSVRQGQIEGNATGEADTYYNVITGFNVLNNQTTPGLDTKYDQISGTIELGKFNYNAIANLASVSAGIGSNQSAIDELQTGLTQLESLLRATSSDVLNNVTLTQKSCDIAVSNGNAVGFGSGSSSGGISFTTTDLSPVNTNCTVTLEPFKITFPAESQGLVNNSRFMIIGQFQQHVTGYGPSTTRRPIRPGRIYIYRTNGADTTEELVFTSASIGSHGTTSNHTTINPNNFSTVVRIKHGDSLRIAADGRVTSGSLDIFKIN